MKKKNRFITIKPGNIVKFDDDPGCLFESVRAKKFTLHNVIDASAPFEGRHLCIVIANVKEKAWQNLYMLTSQHHGWCIIDKFDKYTYR